MDNVLPNAKDISSKDWEHITDLLMIQKYIQRQSGKEISLEQASIVFALNAHAREENMIGAFFVKNDEL